MLESSVTLRSPPNLYRLDLGNYNCNNLQSIHKLPPNLGHLDLTGCSRLQSLPNFPPSLNVLILNDCSSLRSLPELPPNLNFLSLTDCRSLQAIPDLPPNLNKLDASGCTSLEKLPNLSKAKDLHALILTNCSNLTFTFKELILEVFSFLN